MKNPWASHALMSAEQMTYLFDAAGRGAPREKGPPRRSQNRPIEKSRSVPSSVENQMEEASACVRLIP
jgi:hypothetical protein